MNGTSQIDYPSGPTAAGSGASPPPGSGARHAPGPGEQPGRARPRVLIVDDDEEILESLRDLLEIDEAYEVDVAGSLEQARTAIAAQAPDLALIDVKLGAENGISLVPTFKEAQPGIVCIVMTAFHSSDYAVQALRSGADDFIYKPLDPAALLRTLHRSLEKRRLLDESEASERRFRAIFEQSFQLLFVLDPAGTVTEVNHTALTLGGFERDAVVGHPFWQAPWWADLPPNVRLVKDAVAEAAGGRTVRCEIGIRLAAGSLATLDMSLKPVRGDDGRILMLIPEARDVTESKAAQEQLRLGARVFDAAAEAIVVTDREARILDVNPGFVEMTGLEREAVVGRDPKGLAPRLATSAPPHEIHAVIEAEGRWRGEATFERKGGETLTAHVSITAVRDGAGDVTSYVALATDLTDLRSAEERLEHAAGHDALTGLTNRTMLMDRLSVAAASADRHARRLALLVVDVDRFRNVNDTFGHRAGDELLVSIAGRLRGIVRREDTLARLGGDEFVVVLNEIERTSAVHEVADAVLATFEAPFPWTGGSASLSASVGIAVYPDDATDAESLLLNANTAMATAKQSGRSAVRFYDAELHDRTRTRIRLEVDLPEALATGQLHVHYQPKWEVATGTVVGLEALLRWSHPELGEIGPAEFVPVAEDTGLIVPIGEFVLRAACRDAKRWARMHPRPLPVSVNLSMRQFRDERLVPKIESILDELALDPALLEVELTEGLLMDDARRSIAALVQLKKLGVRVAIDDFGTGYSSLSQLQRLPIDTVKIDRSFLAEFDEEGADATLVSTIVSLARGLGLHVIAEGVETIAQLEILEASGCFEVQGFLLSPPLSAERVDEVITRVPRALRDRE